MSRCLFCGQKIKSQPRQGFEQSAKTPFKSAAIAAPMPPDVERHSGVFMPTMESNVKVPLAQSMVSGAFAGACACVGAFTLTYVGGLPLGEVLLTSAATGTLAFFGLSWWQWADRSNYYDGLLWAAERLTGLDINGDDQIGQPTIRAEVKVGRNWKYAALPHDPDNPGSLTDFVRDVEKRTVTFSEEGAIQSGYGKTLFKKLRDGLIKDNFAYWKDEDNHRLGLVFTPSGRALMRSIADTPPPVQE